MFWSSALTSFTKTSFFICIKKQIWLFFCLFNWGKKVMQVWEVSDERTVCELSVFGKRSSQSQYEIRLLQVSDGEKALIICVWKRSRSGLTSGRFAFTSSWVSFLPLGGSLEDRSSAGVTYPFIPAPADAIPQWYSPVTQNPPSRDEARNLSNLVLI